MSWEVVIGLEVHVQLGTRTKLFCGCATDFGAEPNTQTCPVCLGMPGQLPVVNEEAVKKAVLFGLAIGATINLTSRFDRKNYFYPDLPKGYQISQYQTPIVEHGELPVPTGAGEKRIRIVRAHLEEDAGKSLHEAPGVSWIDLNRAGVPLVEIVSAPDIRSADEAVAYLKQLHQLVRFLGISEADMEKGQFRCDANISVRRPGEPLGTRTEIKNVNSFRFVKQALEYEAARQIEILEDGGRVVQETRLFDARRGETRAMRSKEEAHDYRYFPEPDLPPLVLDEGFVEAVRAGLPELPWQMRARFEREYGLSAYDADVLTQSRELAAWYEALVAAHPADPKRCANWLANELLGRLNEQGVEIAEAPVTPAMLGKLLDRIADGTISGKIAKDVLDEMLAGGEDADAVIERKGLRQIADPAAIDAVIREVLDENPGQLAQYRAGKEKLFGYFVGQVMKKTRGKANPKLVNERLKALLEA